MKHGIKSIHLGHLRNEEHFGFHSEFATLVSELSLSEAFESLVAIYNDHYDDLDVAMEVIRRSVCTAEMKTADGYRTATYRRFRFAVKEFTRDADPAKRKAAASLDNIIRHYGNLAQGPRAEKTSAMTNMLQDLRERNADLLVLGLATWLGELEANNLAYQNLKARRHTERATRPVKKVPEARLTQDGDYEAIIKQLDVHGILNPADENCRRLVAELTERVGYYNNLLAQRDGRQEARKARKEEAAGASSSSSSSSMLAA